MTVAQLAAKLFLLAEEGYGNARVYMEISCSNGDERSTHWKTPDVVGRDTLFTENILVIK